MSAHRIFIVDDKDYLCELLAQLVASWPGFSVCGTALSVGEALARVPEADPHLALVDVNLGKGPTGIDLIRLLHTAHPHLRFIVLTGNDDEGLRQEAILAGASGYLLKDQTDDLEPLLRRTLADDGNRQLPGHEEGPSIAPDIP